MSRMKEKNLRRAVALYIAGSIAFSGVVYAAEEESTRFLDGAATVIDEDVYSVAGGSFNASVDTTSITINSNGEVGTVQGGGIVKNGAQADVSQVTIKVNGGTVVDLIAGGKVENGGTANITEKSSVEITGGTVENVTGGGSANSGNAAVKESEITINDGSRIGFFQGGGDAKGDNATSNVDKVTITINGGTFGGVMGDNDYSDESFGGGFATAAVTQGKTNTSTVGDVTININNGTFKNNVYGGGMATVEDEDAETPGLGTASAHVNNVNMNINGGTIETDVYAGGATSAETGKGDDKISSTVDNAVINISGGEIKGSVYAGGMNAATVNNSTINISGGKISGNISADQNVTDSSALNFTTGAGSIIDGAISGFDTVTVKTGANTTFSGANAVDGTAAIQAKALNIEENSTVTVAKNITFNIGSANSPISAAFSLRSARVANGILNLSGELKIMTGAELTLENTTLVSHDKGMVTVGARKDGSTFTVGKLNMDSNSDFANSRVNLNIGLPIDEIKNLSAAEINEIIERALTPAVANNLDIRNGTNAEYQYVKDANGKIIDVKLNDTYLGFYTGVRQANAYIAQNMIGNIHDRNTALRSGEKANDFWVNIRGSKTNIDNQYGKSEIKNQYYQLGYDWDVSSGDDKAVVGVYFSKIYGDITQYNIKSDIDNAYDFGIYGMKEFDNGTYLGLVSRYGQTKNTAKIDDRKVDWKDKGYALSAEFGKRMAQQNGWSVEPYMQLTYNHLSDADLNTGNTDVTLEGSNLLDGKIGVRFIKQEKENQNNNVYAGISYARGLSGDFKMNSRSGMNMTEMDNDTNSFELALGMNRQISKCSTVNLNAKKEFGDYDGWSLQGMLNVNF